MLFPDAAHPWKSKPLGELFRLSLKGLSPQEFPREEFHHYSIPAWDETGGPVLALGKEIESGKLLLTEPGILVSKLNPQIPRVRQFYPPGDGRRACASTEIMPFVPISPDTSIAFYSHYFDSERFRRNLIAAATGTTNSHQRVRPPQTLGWVIPSPPPSEQAAIARILDAVDTALERTRMAVEQARDLERAILEDAFEKLDASRLQLRAFTTDVRYGTSKASSDRGWGSPVLRIPNVVANRLSLDDLAFVELSSFDVDRLQLRDGDLLLVRTNGNPHYVGRSVVFRRPDARTWVYASYLIRVRLNGGLLPEFVNVFLGLERGRRELLRRVTTSAGNHNINSNSIRLLRLPVPISEDAQARVVELAGACRAHVDGLGRKAEALEELKNSLMHDLLTGRVRVKDAVKVVAS